MLIRPQQKLSSKVGLQIYAVVALRITAFCFNQTKQVELTLFPNHSSPRSIATMGFLGLAPAADLAATYDPSEQVLTLFARGDAPNFSYGFEFKRVSWIGGLKFELLAWTGPHAPGTKEYKYSQNFDIPNLNIVDPDGFVDIITLSDPRGRSVKVKWLGFEPTNIIADPFSRIAASPPKSSSVDDKAPKIFNAEAVTIIALYKLPFIIREPLDTGAAASIHMQYADSALVIQNAGSDTGNLFWKFNSIETGKTQVVVTRSTGPTDIIVRKVYNINVVVLENSLAAGDALSGTVKGPIRAILNFIGRVFVAQRIVQRTAPEAEFLSVTASLPRGVIYPVTDPYRLSQLKCIFATKFGTAIIESTGWGEFLPPVFLPYKTVGLNVIDIKSGLFEITDAVDAIRAYGITDAFWSGGLNYPLVAPGESHPEPCYWFHTVTGAYVFVGAKDGKVWVNEVGEKMLPAPPVAETVDDTSS